MGAFQGCESPTSVTIPCSVANLERYAFMDCLNLTSVYFEGNAPSVGWIEVFDWFVGYTNGVLVAEWDPATVYYLPGPPAGARCWAVCNGALESPGAVRRCKLRRQDQSIWVHHHRHIKYSRGHRGEHESSQSYLVSAPNQHPQRQPLYFTDPNWTNYPGRFYRVTWP